MSTVTGTGAVDRSITELRAGPRSRSYLEAVLVHELGFPPHDATQILDSLPNLCPDVVRRTVAIAGSRELQTVVFTLGRQRLVRYISRLEERVRFLSAERLGLTGEAYVRWLMVRCNLFTDITCKDDLGHAITTVDGVTDLVAKYVFDVNEIGELLIEVKNRREVFDYSSDVFFELMDKAIESAMMPVFVSAFLSERGRRFCEAVGIGG